jgi:lysophospholipase L1-like esterase
MSQPSPSHVLPEPPREHRPVAAARRPLGRTRRITLVLAAQVGLFMACELRCRSFVGECGVTPFQVSADPELAAELRPGFATTYAGVDVRINRSGYRGGEFPAPRPGVVRIALVGDSYVFGSGVQEDETLGAVLSARLAEVGLPSDVLAFGVPGYTALDSARVLESRVFEHAPDLVLYVNFANDLHTFKKHTSIPPDAVIDPIDDFRLRSAALEYGILIVRRLGWRFGRHIGNDHRASIEAEYRGPGGDGLRQAIARMQAVCAREGVPFYMVVYPHLAIPGLDPLRYADELLLADAPALGVEALDLLPAFGGARDLTGYWVTPFDTHPNAEGHRRAGRYLADELLQRKLLQRP